MRKQQGMQSMASRFSAFWTQSYPSLPVPLLREFCRRAYIAPDAPHVSARNAMYWDPAGQTCVLIPLLCLLPLCKCAPAVCFLILS